MKEVKKVELVQAIPLVKDTTPDPQGNYLLSEPSEGFNISANTF